MTMKNVVTVSHTGDMYMRSPKCWERQGTATFGGGVADL